MFDDIFPQLIGYQPITGPSLQTYLVKRKSKRGQGVLSNHDEVAKWVKLSSSSGHKWVVSIDEPWWGKRPTGLADILRKEVVWGAALAGGQMEFYAGKDDVKHIEYRTYEDCWTVMGHAAQFMNQHLAKDIANMIPDDDLVMGKDNWAMADQGNVYLLYLKNGGEAKVDLSEAEGQKFSVSWFRPTQWGRVVCRNAGDRDRGR